MRTTRRSFLGGMAVATALSGAAAAKAVASSSQESADLLALGRKFDTTLSEFAECDAALPPLQAVYKRLAPAMPDDLLSRYGWRCGYTDFMSDPADPNYAPLLDDHRRKLEVVQSYNIAARYGATFDKNAKKPDFTDADEEDMRLYRIAQSYERGIERALNESGLDVALSAYRNAQARLRSIIWDLCAVRAKTTEGVAIKVRATAAYSTFGSDEKLQASMLLSQAIWSDLGEDAS